MRPFRDVRFRILPTEPGVQVVPAPGSPSSLTRLASFLELHFVLMHALRPMFLCMTLKTYGFQHFWSIIRLTELSFPCLDPVFMVRKELRCFPTPLAATFGPFQCFPSIGSINRGFSVAMPGVFECR